jgi:hypothetical protein
MMLCILLMFMAYDANSQDRDYTTVRVPRREYERIVEARERYRQTDNQSYIGQLALGAFLGFLAGVAISHLSNDETPQHRRGKPTRTRQKRRR